MRLKNPVGGLSIVLLPLSLLLGGCASTPVFTQYELSSNPEGAEIYRGSSPDNLTLYKTTPFALNTSTSLGWSNKYFQARKKGYKDSEIHHQPFFSMGTATRIHFDLQPNGGREELAVYQQRNTLAAYYEFLQAYPDSPLKQGVYEAMVVLITQQSDPTAAYTRLVETFPDALDSLPDDVRLGYIGPEGMQVRVISELMRQGMGEAIIEQKILSAGKPYAEFTFDEIRQLAAMGLTDKVIAAMLKVTQQSKSSAVPAAAPTLAANPSPAAMPGYVAPGTVAAEGEGLGATMQECATMLAKKEACDQLGGFAGMICMKAIPGGHNCF